ncbi:MAG TPA: M1 family metallopeptidase [Ktedonobacterales bacterium]
MKSSAYRLPTTVLPRHYDIAIDVRLDSEEFGGRVAIELAVSAPTSTIELHARDLRVIAPTLSAGDRFIAATATLDPERELAIITLAEPCPAGAATLSLTFAGRISNSLEGIFVSKDGDDELLCTQCEATGARAIFPCFDEPGFKARFTWQITTGLDTKVLTNGRLVAIAPTEDGARTWTFAPTRPMSTYLLAFAIGDLASTPERVIANVPLRVWALKGSEQLGQFALDFTARLLPYYEDYFAAPYHFEKLDQVAVPNFGAGAMENAGLIISQRIALLLDPQVVSHRHEMLVAETIAHEVAHMWFGNLVTMQWWDDLWLNEAFASWMAYHAVDALAPQYRVWDEIQVGTDRALDTDALMGTHAIYNPVDSPQAIEASFDLITYQKGAAVLRMIHDFLGDDAFRTGLRTYMREFAEGNAAGADLWRHLDQASHLPVATVMESWITQPGHPLVAVGLQGSGADTHLTVSQHRFFSGSHASASDQLWEVPLVVRYEDAAGTHEIRHLLTERAASIPLVVASDPLWCYANGGEVGFYRQRLDTTLRARLLAHLDRLTPAEHKGLLRDQWALVASGDHPIAAYLDTLAALTNGDDVTLIGQIVGDHLLRLEHLLDRVGDEHALVGFRAWVEGLFRDRMTTLGFEPRPDEPPDAVRLRARVVDALTRYAHDPAAIAQARAWQAREADDPTSVDANLAAVAVGTTAQFADVATYERYTQIYQRRKAGDFTPQQVERYIDVFARFDDPALVARTIELMRSDFFPFQSMIRVLGMMLGQPRTQVAAWEFLKSAWPVIQERAPFISPFAIEFSGLLPATLRPDVVAFWDANLHGEYAGPYARALERIDQNADLQALTREDLIAYFHGARPPDPPAAAPAPTADSSAPGMPPAAPDLPPTPLAAPDPRSISFDPAGPEPARGPFAWLRALFRGRG